MSEGESVHQESTETGQSEGDTPEVAPEESIEEEGEEEAEEELGIDEQLAAAKQEAAAHYDR